MNSRLEELKRKARNGEYKSYRKETPIDVLAECENEHLSWVRRIARLTLRQCEAETIVIEPDDRIVYTRTLPAEIPHIYSEAEYERIFAGKTRHESGPINNICADWGKVLANGLCGRKQAAIRAKEKCGGNVETGEFLDSVIETIDAALLLAKRYEEKARSLGRDDLVEALKQAPTHRPRTFHEALQSQRLLLAVLWLAGHYQNCLGRFDQYMWPYLKADLESGRLDRDQAFDLLAEFFISLNRDSDLYPGVQQGDNGQTITLGGVDRDGNSAVNELTILALQVSKEVKLIDPKINLRISSDTDLELLSLATELTREGLGFPQYSNDDVVIPGLVAHGYELADARDYAIAACWEFIIPGKGMDVVNIGAVSFPAAVDQALRKGLSAGKDMQGILNLVRGEIAGQVRRLADLYNHLLLPPAPYYSALMSDNLEEARDLSLGAKYNNFGIHGSGVSNAADALAAVDELIFHKTNCLTC